MVPEGWKLTDLGSLGKWSGGGTPSKSNQDFWDNGVIPWVSPKDMHVQFVVKTQDYITEEAINKSSTKLYPENTVMVVTRSGILRKRLPVALSKKQMAVNQDIKAFPPHKDVCNYFLASFMWCYNETLLAKCAKEGTTVESIDTDSLMSFPIKLPNLKEQKKIAEILSTWDKAITTTEKLLKNSQQQKKALMQQLLTGKKRLLDDYGVRFSGEWRKYKVSNMGETSSGGTPATNKKEFWDGEISWLTPTDVTALETKYAYETKRKITELGVKSSSAKLLPKGSLLICTRATIGAMAISKNYITTNQGFKNLIPNEMFVVEFLYYLFTFQVNKFKRKASGSTFLELSKKDFDKTEFLCPSHKEQVAIAAVLSANDKELESLNYKIKCLKQEKKSLMQQLLTGKRRVEIK